MQSFLTVPRTSHTQSRHKFVELRYFCENLDRTVLAVAVINCESMTARASWVSQSQDHTVIHTVREPAHTTYTYYCQLRVMILGQLVDLCSNLHYSIYNTQDHTEAAMKHRHSYTVWRTSADLDEIQSYYCGESRDVAESLAVRLFVASEYQQDFMVTWRPDSVNTEILGTLFSQRTRALRGECQG